MTTLFLTPLEVVKTRVQAEFSSQTCKKPRKSLALTKHIVQHEGFGGLYSGFRAFLLQLTPNNLIYFWTYESSRDYIIDELHGNKLIAPVYSGVIARTAATYAVAPFELLKTQFQAGSFSRKTTIMQGLRQNVANGGVASLWRGVGPTLWRDVPFSAMYWFFYELFKTKLISHRVRTEYESASDRFIVSFFSGAFAGTVAGVVVTPFDVVKTLRQAEVSNGQSERSTFRVLKKIWGQGNLSGVFAGLGPRLARVPPGCALMISSYEMTKYCFETFR